MVIRVEDSVRIEDLRHHSSEQMEALRALLAAGVAARPDTRHADFYEVSDASTTYYIYISPVNGRILLVAAWAGTPEPRAGRAPRAAA